MQAATPGEQKSNARSRAHNNAMNVVAFVLVRIHIFRAKMSFAPPKFEQSLLRYAVSCRRSSVAVVKLVQIAADAATSLALWGDYRLTGDVLVSINNVRPMPSLLVGRASVQGTRIGVGALLTCRRFSVRSYLQFPSSL